MREARPAGPVATVRVAQALQRDCRAAGRELQAERRRLLALC